MTVEPARIRGASSPRPDALRPLSMTNPVRAYSWGSRTALARLQGRPPSGQPEAEMWMGAHPSGPSLVGPPDGPAIGLDRLIAAQPEHVLGGAVLRRHGQRLPFLMKVLAIDAPLSIQVHPAPAQAARGFVREEAKGIPLDSPQRSYVDPYAKPEILYALTEIEALAGLRSPEDVARLLDLLELSALASVASALRRGTSAALAGLLHWPGADRGPLADAVATRCSAVLAAGGLAEADAGALRCVLRIEQHHRGDPLILAPLLLALHRLPPGGTLFVPCGVPHSHQSGLGVEVMAASDNVLRAGLTPKHVAVDDLLTALDPSLAPVVGPPAVLAPGREHCWAPPVEEFSLGCLELHDGDAVTVGAGAPLPHILLCTKGRISVHDADGVALVLGPGESALVPAACGSVTVTGAGELFRASPALGSGERSDQGVSAL